MRTLSCKHLHPSSAISVECRLFVVPQSWCDAILVLQLCDQPALLRAHVRNMCSLAPSKMELQLPHPVGYESSHQNGCMWWRHILCQHRGLLMALEMTVITKSSAIILSLFHVVKFRLLSFYCKIFDHAVIIQ